MVTVRINDIVDGMEFQTDEMTAYLHRPTGRVVVVSDEAFAAADEGDEDWVAPEELSEAQSIRAHDEDYVALSAGRDDSRRARTQPGEGLRGWLSPGAV